MTLMTFWVSVDLIGFVLKIIAWIGQRQASRYKKRFAAFISSTHGRNSSVLMTYLLWCDTMRNIYRTLKSWLIAS